MIKYETKKLFYDKYLYKLGVHNPLGFIFRNKNLSHARSVIDDLQLSQEEDQPIQYKTCADALRHIDITVDELHDLKYLLTQFQEAENFLEKNIFEIEKLTDNFLNDIYLIVDTPDSLSFGISLLKNN